MDKPINSHDPTSWDWEDNILTQKSSGPESVGLGEGAKHRKASLNDLRSRVVETKDVVNNLITIEPGKVADARQLKELATIIAGMELGLVWQKQVESVKNTPEEGRFIVGDAPTGDWAGHEGEIVEWDGEWQFEEPQRGWAVFVDDVVEVHIFDEGWRMVIDLGRMTQMMEATTQARDDVLDNAGFQAVAADLTGPNKIGDLADRKVKIDALYAELPAIAQKANKDYVDKQLEDTRGDNWNGTTIMDILAQYAVANGLATLDGNGKIYISQIPSLPMIDAHVVDSENEMLGLDAIKGDIAIRTDLPSVFILSSDDPSEIDDWIELTDLQGAVDGALATIKGTGWNGETIKGVSDNLDAHLASSMPHVFRNHEKGKNYNFGFRVSNDGHPQIIFEEEV